jgi:hypothetical protein
MSAGVEGGNRIGVPYAVSRLAGNFDVVGDNFSWFSFTLVTNIVQGGWVDPERLFWDRDML